MGVGGLQEKKNRCFVWSRAVEGGGAGEKKEKENRRGSLISSVIIKRRDPPGGDQSLIRAISSTLGTPTSRAGVCASVCVGSGLGKQRDKRPCLVLEMAALSNSNGGSPGLR